MIYRESDVRNAMNKDNIAFANVYKSINEDLFKMAFYILGNRETAKDIVSETILDAYCGIEKLNDPARFEQWILKILTNKCKRKIKEKYEKFSVFHPNARNIEDYNLAESKYISEHEERTDVQIAMMKLKKEDRMIVSLCVVEGYTSKEVARILSMNSSTVRSRLNRSLDKMKKYLEVKEDEK